MKSHFLTYGSGPSKVDYWIARRDQRNFVNSIKVLASAACIKQHKTSGVWLSEKENGRHQEKIFNQKDEYGNYIEAVLVGVVSAPMSGGSKRAMMMMLLENIIAKVWKELW